MGNEVGFGVDQLNGRREARDERDERDERDGVGRDGGFPLAHCQGVLWDYFNG